MGLLRLSGAVALLYLFAGYELFPFFPALGRYALLPKLSVLFSAASWPSRAFFESLGAWLAGSALVEALAGRRRAGWMIALALLAIPLKLLIVGRTTSGSEILGALLGVACWLLLRGLRRAKLLAALLALAALVISGLTPFRFDSQPQPFTWVPFVALLESPWEPAFMTLLGKSFLYGSAVWLFRESGLGWAASSLIVAIPLAAVEAIQVYLPGRTAEATDPLMAILLGFGLMLMERRGQPRPQPLLA